MQITQCLGISNMQIAPSSMGGGSPLLHGGELLVLNIKYYQDGF